MYNIKDYYFDLPKDLIAQKPVDPPEAARLLIRNWKIIDDYFYNLPKYLTWNEIFIFNDTKVIKARLKWENKEILLINTLDEYTFEALVKPWRFFKEWKTIDSPYWKFEVLKITKNGRILKTNKKIKYLFHKHWEIPLPPYIKHEKDKEKYYQTIFGKKSWSIAAPTASLHFSKKLLNEIKKICKIHYITLHVWIWTFKKIDTENIKDYDIHEEQVIIKKKLIEKIKKYKENWNKIIAVWTTVTRWLESLPFIWQEIIKDIEETKSEIKFFTKLYIYPWFKFKIIDELITNFHLPWSSLLALVAAFMWYENMFKCYNHAIENKYRFFSFWDWMWIKKYWFN